jgi:hypothetical protein
MADVPELGVAERRVLIDQVSKGMEVVDSTLLIDAGVFHESLGLDSSADAADRNLSRRSEFRHQDGPALHQ